MQCLKFGYLLVMQRQINKCMTCVFSIKFSEISVTYGIYDEGRSIDYGSCHIGQL